MSQLVLLIFLRIFNNIEQPANLCRHQGSLCLFSVAFPMLNFELFLFA